MSRGWWALELDMSEKVHSAKPRDKGASPKRFWFAMQEVDNGIEYFGWETWPRKI